MQALEEVFKTTYGGVFQCNRSLQYVLVFKGNTHYFKVQSFLKFKRHIDSIDLNKMLQSTSLANDLEIIASPQSNHLLVLSLCEIIHLKEILNGAKVMLDLNSILQERLFCAFA